MAVKKKNLLVEDKQESEDNASARVKKTKKINTVQVEKAVKENTVPEKVAKPKKNATKNEEASSESETLVKKKKSSVIAKKSVQKENAPTPNYPLPRGIFPTVRTSVKIVEPEFIPESYTPSDDLAEAAPIDARNPFLSLINPELYKEKVAKASELYEKDGVCFTTIESSPLHQPKRIFIQRKRDENGEFKVINSPEFGLRMMNELTDDEGDVG